MSIKRATGVTILEALLVLVIGSAILLLSVRQYQVWKIDNNVRQAQYNVNTVFQAMANFYKANCATADGKLNPNNTSDETVAVNVTKDLKDFITKYSDTPLIDNRSGDGYIAQFNQYKQDRTMCTDKGSDGQCSSGEEVGEVVVWMAQVAIKLPDAIASSGASATAYLQLLGGDCLSKADGKDEVEPCDGSTINPSGSNDKNYVVWQRLPSFASPGSKSDFWVTNPTLVQFNQMYTTYPGGYIMNTSGSTPGKKQYFYCGE